MKKKELKINPVPQDSKFYNIYAHILLLWPFTPFIFAAIYLFFVGDEIRSKIIEQFMKEKVLLISVMIAFLISVLNMFRKLFNYLIIGEKAGSKLKKAQEIPPIKILTKEEFIELKDKFE